MEDYNTNSNKNEIFIETKEKEKHRKSSSLLDSFSEKDILENDEEWKNLNDLVINKLKIK